MFTASLNVTSIFNSRTCSLQRGWLSSFMDSLSDAKRKKEAEIDRICSRHYGDFLTSVSEMLKLRGAASNLTTLVTDVHRKFNTTGSDLVQVVNELNAIQTERENARKLLQSTLQCKKISALMVKTKEQIESDDHYNAMRTIESIQSEMKLLQVKSMTSCLDSWLPIAINKLLYGARSEADGFVANIREHVEVLGSTILGRQAHLNVGNATQNTNNDTGVGLNQTAQSGRRGSGNSRSGSISSESAAGGAASKATRTGRSSIVRSAPSTSTSSSYRYSTSLLHIINHRKVFNLTSWAKATEFDAAVPQHFSMALTAEGEELVDSQLCALAPLHKVLHLYAVLGDLNSYHEHYRSIRSVFLKDLLDRAERIANQNGLAQVLPRLIDQIVGFFTIESAHRRCVEVAEGAFSYLELSALWEEACGVISKLCSSLAITVTSPDVLIRIKEDLLLLIDVATDDAYGFSPKPIFEIMRDLWDTFRGLQITDVVSSCTDALEMCAYQPYSATTLQQFQTQVQAFQLDVIEVSDEDTGARKNNRKPALQLKDRESKREKSLQTGKAAANLDALEEELSLSINSTSPMGSNPMGKRKSIAGMGNEAAKFSSNFESSGGRATIRGSATESMGLGGKNPLSRLSPPPLNGAPNGSASSAGAAESAMTSFQPKTYPFSFAVPLLLRELHLLIIRFFLFAVKNHDLGGRSEDICMAIVSAFEAICKSLRRELNKDGIETPLSKACQIAIDGASLMSASDALWLMVEHGLKHFHWTDHLDRHMTAAMDAATTSLRQLVLAAQDLIFELLSNKIDGLLESLAFINFVPETMPDGPHESVEAIVEFLKITLLWLAHLPPSVRDAVHFTCCTRVAQGILNYILSPQVTKINMLCILAFDFDLKMLVNFSDNCGVPHLKQCFEEFHEMVRCLLHPNLTHYADNQELRQEHFPYTQTSKLVMVLEKMNPTSFLISSGTSRVPVLDKNALKTLLKKLKAQL